MPKETDKIVSKSKDSNVALQQAQRCSAEMAVKMLTLAQAKFGKELTTEEWRSWKEILDGQPSGAIEYAFKEYFRRPPADGERKWFPEEWQILELLKDWRMYGSAAAAEYQPIDFNDPRLATKEQLAEVAKACNELLAKIGTRSEATFKPTKLRRKPLPDWKSKAAGE